MKKVITGLFLLLSFNSTYAEEICGKVVEVTYKAKKSAYVVFESGKKVDLFQGRSKYHSDISIASKTKLATAAIVGNLTLCLDKQKSIAKLKL